MERERFSGQQPPLPSFLSVPPTGRSCVSLGPQETGFPANSLFPSVIKTLFVYINDRTIGT